MSSHFLINSSSSQGLWNKNDGSLKQMSAIFDLMCKVLMSIPRWWLAAFCQVQLHNDVIHLSFHVIGWLVGFSSFITNNHYVENLSQWIQRFDFSRNAEVTEILIILSPFQSYFYFLSCFENYLRLFISLRILKISWIKYWTSICWKCRTSCKLYNSCDRMLHNCVSMILPIKRGFFLTYG